MTTKEHKLLQRAVNILKKEVLGYKSCKEYAIGCVSCDVDETIRKFDSLVNFIISPSDNKK